MSKKNLKDNLKQIATYVGIQHNIYWSNYSKRNNEKNEEEDEDGDLKKGDEFKFNKVFNKKKRIFCKGAHKPYPNQTFVNKFCIDMDKLRINILSVKYKSCRVVVPSLKPQRISDDVKAVIMDTLINKYNSKVFDKILTDDQRLFSTFIRTLKIRNIDMDTFDIGNTNKNMNCY